MIDSLRKIFTGEVETDAPRDLKYYQSRFEDVLLGEITLYAETEEGWSLREITVTKDGALRGSNVKYSDFGLTLNDDHGDYESILADDSGAIDLTEITAAEFEEVWAAHLAQNADRWQTIKRAFPTGTRVTGKLAAYYPQGIVGDFGDAVLGAVNHADFKRSAGIDGFAKYKNLSAIVAGYDEKFQWLVLEKPTVAGAK